MSDFFNIGRVKEAHGLKGELYVVLYSERPEWKGELKEFHCTQPKDSRVVQKFCIEKWFPHKKGIVLAAEELKSRTQAEKLKGFIFSIPKRLLISEPGEKIYLHEIEGFRVFNGNRELGTVEGFFSTAQDILILRTLKGELLIPFVDQLLERINWKEKSIHFKLPENYLESFG